jgi:hypothetical protein
VTCPVENPTQKHKKDIRNCLLILLVEAENISTKNIANESD